MTMTRLISVGCVLLMAALIMGNASASTIVYDTIDSPNTGFNGIGGDFVLNSTVGATATLTYQGIPDTTVGTPSNINFGDFVLVCPTCGTQASGLGTSFPAFTFDLFVSDDTDGAVGEYVGTSTGGSVWSNVSQISISWSPLMLGPGTSGATSGSFGPTDFTISSPTLIVAPNSGSPAGTTTVQGTVTTAVVSTVPEPATLAMVGGAFIALAALARRKRRT